MIGKTLNHYHIVEHLGSGGMGEVYAAEDLKLKRRIALKVLPAAVIRDPERRNRFEREAQAVAALNHPNIVTVHSVELAGDTPFLTMELVEGKTLAEIIPRGGLPIGEILPIAAALTDAVAAVHRQNIFHRDIKPANVMVTSDGRVKMLDFGLAKLNEEAAAGTGLSGMPTSPLSLAGHIVGTLAYMSPEQAEEKPVDQRSDIFSLGVLLHEMAAGERAFKGETTLALLFSIVRDTPPPLNELNPGVPKEFANIVTRCLAKDPRRRYQTAIELRSDIMTVKHDIDSRTAAGIHRVRPHAEHERATIVFASPPFQRVMDQVRAVAATNAAVLIRGESGVGKEMIARRIYEESAHAGRFVKVDCASISRDVFGKLEAADRCTLFLNHVEEMPAGLQADLLGLLHNSTLDRLITGTTRDLTQQVSQGSFRRDLYFRLSVFPIEVPPLRARPEDIPLLVEHFLAGYAAASGRSLPSLTERQAQRLQTYDWPGNVRELKNVVERAVILAGDGPLRFEEALPSSSFSYPAHVSRHQERTSARGFLTAKEFELSERNNLVAAMETAGWRLSGSDGAAAYLGMTVSKLRSRLKALNIKKPEPASLYMRLGASRGIETFARDLFGRAIGHPQLGRFWKGRSTYGVMREEQLLVAYLSSAAGGPAEYAGRDMKKAHHGLGITPNDWEAFNAILNETLAALRVPETERREVTAFTESLRLDIVVQDFSSGTQHDL